MKIQNIYFVFSTAKAIDDVFNVVLMEELVISTVLIGLTTYNVLSKSVMASMFEFFSFVTYSISMIGLIFVYCITGDFLIRESVNVNDAYYECRWYAMSLKYRKDMMICMAQTQKPLQLTAGRFYVFSLRRFGSVMKTAMAYISLLRTVV
uniref:Odorant receptor n=1 Tax=Campoletis chlorideae TaxID=219166 RepID=A0A346D4B8_9HYME|nr:odorant receptor [Campoletis chlorideae]